MRQKEGFMSPHISLNINPSFCLITIKNVTNLISQSSISDVDEYSHLYVPNPFQRQSYAFYCYLPKKNANIYPYNHFYHERNFWLPSVQESMNPNPSPDFCDFSDFCVTFLARTLNIYLSIQSI